jgi:hypothetical protein
MLLSRFELGDGAHGPDMRFGFVIGDGKGMVKNRSPCVCDDGLMGEVSVDDRFWCELV